jgi:hypothetical protein
MICSNDPQNVKIKMDDGAPKQVPKLKALSKYLQKMGKIKKI